MKWNKFKFIKQKSLSIVSWVSQMHNHAWIKKQTTFHAVYNYQCRCRSVGVGWPLQRPDAVSLSDSPEGATANNVSRWSV